MSDSVAVKSVNRAGYFMHVTVGHENWTPTRAELEEVARMFADANNDPLGGAVVTTR